MSKKLLNAVLIELQALRAQITYGVPIMPAIPVSMPPTPKGAHPSVAMKNNRHSIDKGPFFYRYLRPTDEYCDVQSQAGVTFKIDFDYQDRTLGFSYAICDHKNGEPSFCKATGKSMVNGRKQYKIPLWESPGELKGTNITTFIVSAIYNKKVDIPPGDRKMIINQFSRSCSRFHILEA